MGKSTAVDCGNINAKGKREVALSCGCCVCVDLRHEKTSKQVMREMKAELADNQKS